MISISNDWKDTLIIAPNTNTNNNMILSSRDVQQLTNTTLYYSEVRLLYGTRTIWSRESELARYVRYRTSLSLETRESCVARLCLIFRGNWKATVQASLLGFV